MDQDDWLVSGIIPYGCHLTYITPLVISDLSNQPHHLQQTEKYHFECCDYMAHFIIFVLRTFRNPSPYHPLYLTSEQINAAQDLDDALDNPHIQLTGRIHSLCYALMSTSRPEIADDQFLCPHVVFLVFSNLRADGVFETTETISKYLSKLTWDIRSTAVQEAFEHREDYPEGLLG
jgi:hypothetical protein